jgi:hypothetical protein
MFRCAEREVEDLFCGRPWGIEMLGLWAELQFACFLLHIFCLRLGEECPEQWVAEALADGVQHPCPTSQGLSTADDVGSEEAKAAGIALRARLFQLHAHIPNDAN